MIGAAVFMTIWVWDNIDFVTTKNEQLALGYEWVEIDCRKPDTSLPHFTWMGEVCYKLVK
jgi:hypothetical protein